MGVNINKQEEFAKKFKEMLIVRGITQKELAKETGVTEASISAYKHGNREPYEKTLLKIMKALDINKEYWGDTYIFESTEQQAEVTVEEQKKSIIVDRNNRDDWKIGFKSFSDIVEISKELGALRYRLIQLAESNREDIKKYDKEDQTFLHKLEFLDELSDEEATAMVIKEKKSREERRVVKNRGYVIKTLLDSLGIKNPNAVVVQAINSKGDIVEKMNELKKDKTLFV